MFFLRGGSPGFSLFQAFGVFGFGVRAFWGGGRPEMARPSLGGSNTCKMDIAKSPRQIPSPSLRAKFLDLPVLDLLRALRSLPWLCRFRWVCRFRWLCFGFAGFAGFDALALLLLLCFGFALAALLRARCSAPVVRSSMRCAPGVVRP